jgi:hypothetical protein
MFEWMIAEELSLGDSMNKFIYASLGLFFCASSVYATDAFYEYAAFYGAAANSPRECLTAEQPIFWCVSDTEIRGCTKRSPRGGNNAECFGGVQGQYAICNATNGTQDFTGCRLF